MSDRSTYRSKWVVPDPWTVLENGYVQMAGGVIEAVGSGAPPDDGPVFDLGPGALMAPLVNAHTHLELSALKGLLPFNSGFLHWVTALLQKRASLSDDALLVGASNAIQELKTSGCRVLAEISSLGITRQLLLDSNLDGIFFEEHLGNNNPSVFKAETSDHFFTSLAAHAPHTTAPELLRHIKKTTLSNGLPMSIHLSESEDEFQFINCGQGLWANFLTERNIDFSDWPLVGKSPVQYLNSLEVLDDLTLAVHLLWCSEEDIELLRKKDVKICFCPRSNFLLHQKLPDIHSFLATGAKPCLGTDSLASSPSLSILDEMAFIASNYDNVSPTDILSMGTVYGAAALGMDNRFGCLSPGFEGAPFYVPIQVGKSTEVTTAIVSAGNAEINRNPRESTEK